MKKMLLACLIVICSISLFGCVYEDEQTSNHTEISSNKPKEKKKAKADKKKEVKKEDKDIYKQKETLVAVTQLALKDYEISDDTSPKVEDWEINNQGDQWIVTTVTPNHKRIKTIIQWSGDILEESTLIYLLVDGNEYLNKL